MMTVTRCALTTMDSQTVMLYITLLVVNIAAEFLQGGESENSIQKENTPIEQELLVVRVKTQGLVRGRKSEDGSYDEYLGIPYATASPENRFKSPLPVPTWAGIREANVEVVTCPQWDSASGRLVGVEDCLVLNVYVPGHKTSKGSLPVMVYVHGGGFTKGSGAKNPYGPDWLMEENVILVTFNYRLSILGFLCFEDTANGGVKDVMAVLHWIQANIRSFGGDPRKVTLFGQSAGAAIVELLMLTKKTERLFQGSIAQSGSVLSPWAFGSDPEKKAFTVGRKLGYEGQNRKQLMEVLKNATVDSLIEATEGLLNKFLFDYLPISPCIEPSSNVDAVISTDPWSIIKSGSYNEVPYLLGFTKDEGLIVHDFLNRVPDFLYHVQRDFSHTIPKDLQNELGADRISELATQFYFNEMNISKENMDKFVEYITDTSYILPAVHAVRSYIGSGRIAPVFLYEFAYDGGLGFLKGRLGLTGPGVCHADELGYIFKQRGVSPNQLDDKRMIRTLVKLWTNFAKFSNPTHETSELIPVKWKPTVGDALEYLSIDRTLKMEREPFKMRVDFWDNIYRNYSSHLF